MVEKRQRTVAADGPGVPARRLHPDMWEYLVHLTGRPGRPNPRTPRNIRVLSAEGRLASILSDGFIRGFRPFGNCSLPMVCFTESTQAGLDHLISERDYPAWGIVFRKQTILDGGGGPVWYARQSQWDALAPDLRSWAVRTEPGQADWFHEREWRVPTNGRPAAFSFQPQDVHAVIAAKIVWPGGPPDGDGGFIEPSWADGVCRWWWSPRGQRLWECERFGRTRTLYK